MKNKWISGILCICVLSALTGCSIEKKDIMQTEKISGNIAEMLNGVKIPVPGRSSKKAQKAYRDVCRKEAFK